MYVELQLTRESEGDIKIKIMTLHVDDQEKALGFYTDKLGFVWLVIAASL